MANARAPTSRAIVVDDDPALRRAIRQTLERGGWGVDDASDIVQAIDLVRASRPRFDVAVLDVVLGAESGLELAVALHRLDPALHFLFISGYPDLDVRVAGIPRGSFTFVGKPLSATRLIEKANALRARSRGSGDHPLMR